MLTRLTSGTTEAKLQHTLAQWRQWRCEPKLAAPPEVERVLGDGHSNHSFLTAGETPFVVRIDGINPAEHGLNRFHEWRCLHSASSAGIAPQPVYFNPDLCCLVSRYLPPDAVNLGAPLATTPVAALLRAVHQLPPRHYRLDLAQRVGRYRQRLAEAAGSGASAPFLQEFDTPIDSLLEMLAQHQTPLVLCHNDLLNANRITSSGTLYALDWEYAATGSALFDLAVIIEGDCLSETAADQLLEAYFQRDPAPQEHLAINRNRAVYLYLELMWYRLHPADHVEAAWMMAREQRLRTCMDALRASA